MAESRGSEEAQNIELKSFTSSKNSEGHYVLGKLLSMEETYKILHQSVSYSGQKMLESLKNVKKHDFQATQQCFPVLKLQHVTKKSSMREIIRTNGFGTTNVIVKPEFEDLLYWSADIATEDIEAAREKCCQPIAFPNLFQSERNRIKGQFANSPAFSKSGSRYGNFKFSFPMSYLLSLYQTQHCGGGEPQMRILGTDLYKQEIAHYILVHSPANSRRFKDLPIVPCDESCSGHPPFVFCRDGRLYWRPESTSSTLKEMISDHGRVLPRKCYVDCDYFIDNNRCYHLRNEYYEVWSVWNHLVFAFHLPNNGFLEVPEQELRENLSPCAIEEPTLTDESERLALSTAEEIVTSIKSGIP